MKLSIFLLASLFVSFAQAADGFSSDLEGRFLLVKDAVGKEQERMALHCASLVEITLYDENKTLILEKYKKFFGLQEEAIHFENTGCELNAYSLRNGEVVICKTSSTRAHKVAAYNLNEKKSLISAGSVKVELGETNKNTLTISRSSSVHAPSLGKITSDEIKCRYVRLR